MYSCDAPDADPPIPPHLNRWTSDVQVHSIEYYSILASTHPMVEEYSHEYHEIEDDWFAAWAEEDGVSEEELHDWLCDMAEEGRQIVAEEYASALMDCR